MTRDQLISRIEECASVAGIAPATVTGRAVGNSRLYRRLKGGGDCTTEIAAKVDSYISSRLAQAAQGNAA